MRFSNNLNKKGEMSVPEEKGGQRNYYVYEGEELEYEFIEWDKLIGLNLWHNHPWYNEIEKTKVTELGLHNTYQLHQLDELMNIFKFHISENVKWFYIKDHLYANFSVPQMEEFVANINDIKYIFQQIKNEAEIKDLQIKFRAGLNEKRKILSQIKEATQKKES